MAFTGILVSSPGAADGVAFTGIHASSLGAAEGLEPRLLPRARLCEAAIGLRRLGCGSAVGLRRLGRGGSATRVGLRRLGLRRLGGGSGCVAFGLRRLGLRPLGLRRLGVEAANGTGSSFIDRFIIRRMPAEPART